MRVFVSYHTPDLERALAVQAAISLRRPGIRFYLAPRNNVAGAYWLPRLADEIAASDAVLFLAGNRIGPWQELEYQAALRLSRETGGRPRLVPVVMSLQAPGLPFFAELHQIFAADPLAPESVAAIERALDDGVPPATTPAWQRFQPYKGLPALDESDAAFFFGREGETAEILDLLASRPDRVVALIGHSGVGKSSLARAGVLAAMRSQFWPLAGKTWPPGLADSRSFLPLVVRPGEAPLKELALAFAQLYLSETYEIDREARGWAENFADGAKLHDLLRVTRDKVAAALNAEPPKRFVLYLDQTEELYAGGDPAIAQRFSSLIAEAADDEVFSVMMSLRSDYYSAYQDDTDLFRASERVDILPLLPKALIEIVRRPALSLGAKFESEDMSLLVAEATRRQPGALPLLSDLMHEMWLNMQARGDGVLRWSDNPGIVDVGAPLRRRADAFLARLGKDETTVRRLFTLRLANVPKSGEPVRRRVRRDECTSEEWALAELLATQEWRLLSLAHAADNEPVAEVAHDQLLRSWPRLESWLAEEREFLIWRGLVEYEIEEQESDLVSGRRLAVARGWYERREADLAPKLRAFIAQSIAADDDRMIAERRRRRQSFAVITAGLVVALVLAGILGWGWRVAHYANIETQRQQSHAKRSLALAVKTANAFIDDLAETYRNRIPPDITQDMLDRAFILQSELAASGDISPDLKLGQAHEMMTAASTFLSLDNTSHAFETAQNARALVEELLKNNPTNFNYRHELGVVDVVDGDVLRADPRRRDSC